MFDIGWSELLVIAVVALIAIGPKELPGALRALGHWMGKIRRMAGEFQSQFQEAMREAEMADIKKQVDSLTSGFDPIEATRREIESAIDAKPPSVLAETGAAASPAPSTSGEAGSTDAPDPQVPPPGPPPETESHKELVGDAPVGAKPGDRPA
jgi:sec-independent protein translocase protein TatB